MSDKTFLQELQSIKRKLELAHDNYDDAEYMEIPEDINEIIGDINGMITQCIEIQNNMTGITKEILRKY